MSSSASYEGSKVVEVAVEAKSDKTLKNNMNSKNGTLRKRTSLVIVPQVADDNHPDNYDNNDIHSSPSNTMPSGKGSPNDSNANKIESSNSVSSTAVQHAKQKLLHHSLGSPSHSAVSITDNAEYPKKSMTSQTRLTANTNDRNKSNRNSIVSIDSCMSRSSDSTSARSSSSSISSHGSNSIAEASGTSDEDVAVGNYRYLENENTPDDAEDCYNKNSISSVSPCTGGYSLQEKLQNIMNDKLKSQTDSCGSLRGKTNEAKPKFIEKGNGDCVDAHLKDVPKCQELMSPQEVPFGRRYAGVSQFKPNTRLPVPSSLTQTIIQTKNQLRPTNASASTIKTPANINNFLGNTTKCRNQSNATILNPTTSFCGLDSAKGSELKAADEIATKSKFSGHAESSSNALETDGAKRFNENLITNDENINIGAKQRHSLEENENSCYDRKTPFDDDLQALLPNGNSHLRDDRSQSRTSLVSSSDGGVLAEGETSSETSHSSKEFLQCDLGLSERLLLTHPVWFLPGIQRSGAVHFLQGKEEGNFIVRGSSQPNTMAVSVRLPPDTGPYIEHYLIQSVDGILCLESSRFKFDSIPALIEHYAQCCDELPVQLVLPRALREVKNRQQLSSLALLGQEFWWYPMACPKSNETGEALLLDAKSPNSLTDTSGLGTTVFSNSMDSHETQAVAKVFSPTKNAMGGMFSQAGTPSDTTSSMSSFTTSGGQHMQLRSPESIDSVILTMSPVDLNGQSNGFDCLGSRDMCNMPGNLITFKTNDANNFSSKNNKNLLENNVRTQRPKPPNTLNLDFRKPPAPPARWSKPLSPSNPVPQEFNSNSQANNFTVTTTVTFSMDNRNSPQLVEVTTPSTNNTLCSVMNSNTTFQTFAKRLSPEGECKDSSSLHGSSQSSRWQSHSSKDSNNSQRKILSPCSNGTPTSLFGSVSSSSSKSRKSKARKESKHYQESDILESPQVYCRSTLIDKISDYEDLWSHDPSDRTGLLSSFKPNESAVEKRTDQAAETPTITSLNANLLSPANSSIVSTSPPNDNNDFITSADSTSDTQQLIQFSVNAQPRSRAGLILPGLMSHSASEDVLKTELAKDHTSSALQTPGQHSKQGSPFYAEPADALLQAGLTSTSILRRSQRGPLLPTNQRHSEPPKSGLIKTSTFPLIEPPENPKVAGSLDELKKKQQQSGKRGRGRMEHWQLDSSWEFMVRNDEENDEECNGGKLYGSSYGDYDSEEQWKPQNKVDKENSLGRDSRTNKKKPITVHQIIAERLPDLNLPEFIKCTMPLKTEDVSSNTKQMNEMNKNQKVYDNQGVNRLSAYDNVERNLSICQTYFNNTDSAPSDDGTVFSEPWDSSQWDSLMPNDDTTITSDTIHLSKCRPIVSEDDTIIEELSSKENNQDTLKPKKLNGSKQKVATILRNPSIRDREILCHPRNKINPNGTAGPGDSVRAYTLQLAEDESSTFARNIENFISCTKESREAAPQVVMRNMRQFMNGMKNYLVKHGEGKFQEEVESARSRLKPDEFLNLDAILETVMHQLIVLPLREHLYRMFVDYYTRSEDIQLLVTNIKHACARSPADFGIRSTVTPPSATSLLVISNLLLRLQEAESPLDKLELFLCVISTIFDATGCPRGQQLGADDFLPILVYVVAKCEFVCAEIEAEFMWGLLQPTLLNGEPGYYLTALCSAVHVLKNFMTSGAENGKGSLDWRSSSTPTCSSVLRVIIPDECNGSLQTRTLPVRPHTTTREVCRIIAHKARITNPQDYALFKVIDGEETPLTDVECPQDVRLSAKGKHCMLAYKRLDAKIAWPTAT